jgi:hypothetical protein
MLPASAQMLADLAAALGLPEDHGREWADLLDAVRALRAASVGAAANPERADEAALLLQRVVGRIADSIGTEDAASVHEILIYVALLRSSGYTEAEALAAVGCGPASGPTRPASNPEQPLAAAPPRNAAAAAAANRATLSFFSRRARRG